MGGTTSGPQSRGHAHPAPDAGEHLEWQLQLSAFSAEERAVAHWIIGNLNDDGYLCSSVEELARQSGAPEELVEAALAKVQQLDPPGVAARDLRECLLLQLDALRSSPTRWSARSCRNTSTCSRSATFAG